MGGSQIWPGWETVRVIGSGGFGKVYEIRKAEEQKTGEYRSALKVIPIPRSPEDFRAYADDGYDEQSIAAIFRSQIDDIVSEFQMMSQFRGTSNIVSYEDHMIVPHEDGRGWDILIRMELLTALPEYFSQHGMSEADTVKLGQDICRALELCGKSNIIHRDIKPQNIFVNHFGDFKLGDFGIARSMDHTTQATKIGTYNYMAPEVFRNMPYGASVDIYSLGLVMYWLLNERRLPFLPLPPVVPTAIQNNEAQLKRLSGAPIPPPKNGSPALQEAVLKACSFDAARRFDSPEAFRRALEACGQDQERVIPPSQDPPEAETDTWTSPGYVSGGWSMKTPPSREGWQYRGKKPAEPASGYVSGGWSMKRPPSGGEWRYRPGRRPDSGGSGTPQGPAGEGPASSEWIEDAACPWCGGTGRDTVIHRKSAKKYWASAQPCGACAGTGTVLSSTAKTIQEDIHSRQRQLSLPEDGRFDPSCPCCSGKGFVTEAAKQPALKPCPRCGGLSVLFPNPVRKRRVIALLLLFTFLNLQCFYEGRVKQGLCYWAILLAGALIPSLATVSVLAYVVFLFIELLGTLRRPKTYWMCRGVLVYDWEKANR